jgi:hypothetical protein
VIAVPFAALPALTNPSILEQNPGKICEEKKAPSRKHDGAFGIQAMFSVPVAPAYWVFPPTLSHRGEILSFR